jgi:hypothetical protein
VNEKLSLSGLELLKLNGVVKTPAKMPFVSVPVKLVPLWLKGRVELSVSIAKAVVPKFDKTCAFEV